MNRLSTTVLSLVLAIPSASAFAQSPEITESLDELGLSRALVSNLQDSFGPMDPRLLEPIEQLADQLAELNQFDEAHAFLDRAMQIARIEDGLYTEAQRPLLYKKIENYANRSDWESAREGMEHLLWLYAEKSVYLNQALIDDLLELSRMHLRGLAEDAGFWQGYHFRKSEQIRWLALGVAEKLWGETDERLIPIIYEQLRQLHLQTVALWRGGATSYSLREVAPGSEIMRDRSDVNETFYLTGLGLINDIYMIYAAAEDPKLESLAMTDVYMADWHILYNKPEAATDTYRNAYENMLEAGVRESLIDELFIQPIVIPDTEFYGTVDSAVSAQRSKLVTEEGEGLQPYLSFSEWSAALPSVRNPITSFASEGELLDSNFALFSFSLAGVNKTSRWYRHRFVSTVNMIEQAELLAHYFESPPEEPQLLDKLNSLTFRPKMVGGEPQQATGRLKYHFAN